MAANRVTGVVVAQPAVQTCTVVPYSPEPHPDGSERQPIQFDFSASGLAANRQDDFKAQFVRELTHLERWVADRDWPIAAPPLNVIVSGQFRISKSLVPAWSGDPGLMQFPSWRVAAGKAAIAHELVHVFLPNGNRLLAEGLAVYLQASIGGNPAFPNFGRPLHDLVRELVSRMVPAFRQSDPASLEAVRLADLDAIATPAPLTLNVDGDLYGEEPRGQAHIYPLAGSFVQHLIETRGLESFRKLYARTPLVALHQDAGAPDRWAESYGCPLATLESEWRSMIAGR